MDKRVRRKNDWFSTMSNLTQYDWNEHIKLIKDEETQMRIALIIWWDFFDTKSYADYSEVFLPYLKKRMKFHKTKLDLYEELAKIYPPEEAARRLGGK